MVLCYSQQRLMRLQYVLQLHSSSSSQLAASAGIAAAANEGAAVSSSRSSTGSASKKRRSRAAGGSADAVRQQQQGLAGVAWRVLVQESDAAFSRRYPAALAGPAVWLPTAAQRKKAAQEAEAEDWRQLEAAKKQCGQGKAAPSSPGSLIWKTREPLFDSCAQSDRTPLLPTGAPCGHEHED
ncbi:hypothetical protein OEZ86_007419 [Tetradesmus obliquus]|nr:hypothetical protein OEZ86_007419 [Tetradesmus obliquus]